MTISAIRSPFSPGPIAFVARLAGPTDRPLLNPAETKILESITSIRRREQFLSGRIAAHEALRSAGFSGSEPIKQGPRGEPLWPAGWNGSIAHTGDVAVAAAAPIDPASGLRGVGVDIEIAHRPLRPDLGRRICTDNEKRYLPDEEDERRFALIRIFSAKEAVYKAIYPIVGRFLEFRDVELDLFDAAGKSTARLDYGGAPGGFVIEVSAASGGGYLVTGAEVYSA